MKNILFPLSALMIVLFLSITSCIQNKQLPGNDWLTWRGPNFDGTTNETEWNPMAIADSSNLLWKADIGKGHGSVAVKGELVFVFGNKPVYEGSDTTDYDHIACLNANTGAEIWTYKFKSEAGRFPGPCSSPVINGENLYIFSRNGDLICLNAANGELIWKDQLADKGYKSTDFGFGASPVILKDMLLLKVGEKGFAFDKQNGDEIWFGDTTQTSTYSSVVPFKHNDEDKIVLINDDTLLIAEPETGEVLKSIYWTEIGSDPIMYKNKVFVSNMNDGAAMYDISTNEIQEVWKNDSIRGLFQGFAIHGNYAYGLAKGRKDDYIVCLNLENGKSEWQQDFDKWGSLIIADNKLIIISGDGQLVIAEATSEKYTEIVRQQIFDLDPEAYKRNTDCCWTIPVLSHSKIYARTTMGELVCVDVSI